MKIAHSLSAIALGLTLATQVNAAEFTFAKSIKSNDNTLVLFLDTDSQVANFNYLKPETQTHLNKVIEFSDFKAGYGKTLEVIAPNGSDINASTCWLRRAAKTRCSKNGKTRW